ncbi:MAG TPA: amidase, partial [Porphyromonadaceae bacterium]|nr:amidase [Porphyromonadaceae bacterium]HCB87879.1 amidase [Porphyromonadaceae bacterium]
MKTLRSGLKNVFFSFLLMGLMGCNSLAEKDPKIDLEEITIADLQQGYKTGKFTIVGITQAYLDRIEAIDKNGPALNAVIRVNPDALEIAASLDEELRQGKSRGAMHGIPVLLKDNIDTHDKMPNTA